MQKEQKCPPTRSSSPLFRTTSSSWPHLLTRAPTRPLLLSALQIPPPSGVVSPGNPSSFQGLPSALWTGLSTPGCSPLTSGPSLCLQSPLFPSRPSHPSRPSPPPSGSPPPLSSFLLPPGSPSSMCPLTFQGPCLTSGPGSLPYGTPLPSGSLLLLGHPLSSRPSPLRPPSVL